MKILERTYLIVGDLAGRVGTQDLDDPGGIGGRQPEVGDQTDEEPHRHQVEGEVREEAEHQAGRQVHEGPASTADLRVPQQEGHRPLHVFILWKAKQGKTTSHGENFFFCLPNHLRQNALSWCTQRLQLTEGMLSWW